jgi:hypothetical protein
VAEKRHWVRFNIDLKTHARATRDGRAMLIKYQLSDSRLVAH